MPRLLITDLLIRPPAEIAEGCVVIAPDPSPFRANAVQAMTLYQAAKESLKFKGFGIASPIKSAESLRSAVHRVMPNEDAGAAARHYRETIAGVLRSGIDFEKLISVGSQRARIAGLIAAEYIEILKRNRLVDRDAVFAEAVRNDAVEPKKVVIYGYFRARQLPARSEEIEFIDRLADDGSVFYLPCGQEPIFAANLDWVEFLTRRAWQVAPSETDRSNRRTKIDELAMRFASGLIKDDDQFSADFKAFEYASLEKEIRGTLARAKAAVLGGVPIERTVIACRDMNVYVRPLIAAGREYGLPLDIDFRVPIADTAFGELISLIFQTIDQRSETRPETDISGFEYEPTIRLLMHRLGPGLSDDARVAAYGTLPAGFDRWKQIVDEVEILRTSGKRSASEWTRWLNSILARWEVRGATKLGAYAAELEAYDRFFRSLDQLAFERGTEPIEIFKYAAEVSDVLLNVSTPAHTEKGGVRVRQPNEIVGSDFDAMFVVGMAEGMLPAPAADSSVIDFFECEVLRTHGIHFQNALEVPRWEAITFYFMLLASCGSVTFSYPLFAGESERLKSSYFKRMGIRPQKPNDVFVSSVSEFRQAFLLKCDDSGDEVITNARHQHSVEDRRESGQPPDEYDGVIGIPIVRKSWSASSLAKIGSCPFKWFASDLLRLRVPEEADTDLPANARGTLLHKTLELAVGRSRSRGAAGLRFAVTEALETAFAEAEALDKSLALVTNWHLRRSEQIEKLRVAIASEDFIEDGATVLEVEKPFEAEFCGLTIKGTIDRIDILGEDRMLALDYKHGSYLAKVKDENGYLSIEIQLPLYSMVALPKLYPGTDSSGRFFHLSDPKKTEAKIVDLVAVISRIKTLLDTGNFAVDPDQQSKACEYCEFDVVCRVGPRLERRSSGA